MHVKAFVSTRSCALNVTTKGNVRASFLSFRSFHDRTNERIRKGRGVYLSTRGDVEAWINVRITRIANWSDAKNSIEIEISRVRVNIVRLALVVTISSHPPFSRHQLYCKECIILFFPIFERNNTDIFNCFLMRAFSFFSFFLYTKQDSRKERFFRRNSSSVSFRFRRSIEFAETFGLFSV